MKHQPDRIPSALYARVSSDRQDVDLSVAAQLRALRDFAERNGNVVAREYINEAESGRDADRPQFRKMLDEASGPDAPFREILVWKFSRFTRKREHADDTPTGKLMEAIIESVDEFYSENLGARGHARDARGGLAWLLSRIEGPVRLQAHQGPGWPQGASDARSRP